MTGSAWHGNAAPEMETGHLDLGNRTGIDGCSLRSDAVVWN